MDERPTWDVDRRHESGEREQDRRVREEGPEVGGSPAHPAADHHERGEDTGTHEGDEDPDGGDETQDAADEQWPDALAERPVDRGRRRYRAPLADRADVEDLAGRRRRRQLAEDLQLAPPPRGHDQQEQAEAG